MEAPPFGGWVSGKESCLVQVRPEAPPERLVGRELAGRRLSRSRVFLSRLQPEVDAGKLWALVQARESLANKQVLP